MIKSTGIIRRVDELGRVVIPKEIRIQFKIEEKDPIEVYVEGNSIVLRKYEDTCIFCGKKNELQNFSNKLICKKCCEDIKNLIK